MIRLIYAWRKPHKKRINMDKITAFPYLADMVCRVTDHRSHLATIGVDIISIISKIHWYDTFLEYRSPGMLTVGRLESQMHVLWKFLRERKSKDLNMIAKINEMDNTQRNTTDINDSVQHHNETQQTSMTVYNITTKHNRHQRQCTTSQRSTTDINDSVQHHNETQHRVK
jgi:hypothetical protein